ncbi:MAG: indole-3-glycerol phosphate synthase TrpC [Armatimonadota bacterium]
MSVPSILQKIVAHKRQEVAVRKAARPVVSLADAPPVRDFAAALRGETVRLIAEVKQSSPSKGVIQSDFDPVAIARTYAQNGAAAISVLTDEEFFKGHDRYLQAVRGAVDVPLLRKEFLVDPWQIDESRALGADAVLLIVAILSPEELRHFQRRAHELGMAALVETHTEEELRVALEIDAPLIGVNNRNLHTFETTLETTERLAALAGDLSGRTLVSESGIYTAADVAQVASRGARAVLVGEALMRDRDPAARVRELAGVSIASR